MYLIMMLLQILEVVRSYPVVIIEGHTGCGKTTQVPQYIFDDCRSRSEYCNIVITQPRRIAAMSIAQRVATERNWPLGSIVGYKVHILNVKYNLTCHISHLQIGLKTSSSDDTRMLYCTTGVLLQMLIASRTMSRFTHIILDEVHERDKDMDFLMLLVRKLQRTIDKNIKVCDWKSSKWLLNKDFFTYFITD